MGKINITERQKAELNRRGVLVLPNSSVDAQPFITYHDPRTGQEFSRLPADQYSLMNYMMKGWVPGPAPEDLRQGWEAERPKREATYRARLRESKGDAIEGVEDNIQERINVAVREALRAVGVIPSAPTEHPAPAAEILPQKLVQLKLL